MVSDCGVLAVGLTLERLIARAPLPSRVKLVGLNPHPFRHAFADHDACQVGVGARDRGHDRGIGNSEAGETVHAPVLVHDGIRITCRPHAGSANGMHIMAHKALDEGIRPLISLGEGDEF